MELIVKQEYLEYVFSLPEFKVAWSLPTELEEVLLALYMDDQPHPFSFTDHWRGTGAHLDHRWLRGTKKGGMLDGMTVAHMKPGITKEPVRTLEQARKLMKDDKNWKISNEPGPLRMFATPKKPEPYEWLNYEGVIEPREIRPGVPGSTRFEWGVFATRDKGVQYYGAQKPYFKEFFLYGKKYTGRWIYRMIPRRKPADAAAQYLFLFGKPIDQTPYVLSKRAKDDKWVPPQGVSCLPPEVKRKIPDNFQYWKFRNEEKRLSVRDALLDAIKEGKVKLEGPASFVLQWQVFRKPGKKPVRPGPTIEHWHLWIREGSKVMRFVLTSDPLTADQPIAAIEKVVRDSSWMKKEGFVPPNTPIWNPRKETLSWLYILDKGPATVFEDSEMFKKIQFKGKKLKGLYTLQREAKGQAIFIFQKSKLPGET